jgi:hypothetical protein
MSAQSQQNNATIERVAHDNTADAPLRDDLLFGARQIARELGIGERRAYYLLECKHLPAMKVGRNWIGSRRRLRAHFSSDVK